MVALSHTQQKWEIKNKILKLHWAVTKDVDESINENLWSFMHEFCCCFSWWEANPSEKNNELLTWNLSRSQHFLSQLKLNVILNDCTKPQNQPTLDQVNSVSSLGSWNYVKISSLICYKLYYSINFSLDEGFYKSQLLECRFFLFFADFKSHSSFFSCADEKSWLFIMLL